MLSTLISTGGICAPPDVDGNVLGSAYHLLSFVFFTAITNSSGSDRPRKVTGALSVPDTGSRNVTVAVFVAAPEPLPNASGVYEYTNV